MARCLHLPYKATNPRSVRGAKKHGWTVVDVDLRGLKDRVSWMGLCIWSERGAAGYWVASHFLKQFAFENSADALAFKMKWG